MITQGDYSEFVDRQVQHLLDDNPDAQAIVFANDDMAFSGYRVYEKRGHKVGKDLYEAKNTTRALSVELKMVARSATISVFKVKSDSICTKYLSNIRHRILRHGTGTSLHLSSICDDHGT